MLNKIFEITTSSRIHWVYLASSFFISLLFILFIKYKKLFTLKYLWNSSSKIDLQLFFTNRILKFFIILPIEGFLIFSLSKYWLSLGATPYINLNLSSSLAVGLFTLLLFIFDDFLRFIQHYTMHKVPALWEIHKVHHSAHTLNIFTLYRTHPVEVMISSMRRVFGTVLVTCFMLSISSQTMRGYEIFGALTLNFIFNLIGGNLRHSHIPLSFGPLEKLFISPAQHQIHHSKNPKHFDKNFGIAISVWDSLFSTWLPGSSQQKLSFGINYKDRNHKNSLISSVVAPLKAAFNKLSFKQF